MSEKAKELEEKEFASFLDLSEQEFEKRYKTNPFFQQRVDSKIRRFEEQQRRAESDKGSTEESDTDDSTTTLRQIRGKACRNMQTLYERFLRIS